MYVCMCVEKENGRCKRSLVVWLVVVFVAVSRLSPVSQTTNAKDASGRPQLPCCLCGLSRRVKITTEGFRGGIRFSCVSVCVLLMDV